MQQKIQKIFFDFQIIAFLLVALNTRFYWEREFFSSDVNMLKNRLNISDTTKKEFFDLIFFQRDQKVWLKHCRAYLSSLSAP